MRFLKKDDGYAMIIVLAFIMIASIFTIPYLTNFLHDTREIGIEITKNQNIYLLESAAQITKALVEENNIMSEEELADVLASLDYNSMTLLNSKIASQLDKEKNTITFLNQDGSMSQRTNSKLTLTYKTVNLTVFDEFPIIVGNKLAGENKIKGNNNFKDSYIPITDVLQISKEVYEHLIQQKLELFRDTFVITEQDQFYQELELNAEENILLNSLWVDGSANLSVEKNKRIDFVVLGDMYVTGDLNIDKFENVIVYGDLVVYGDSFDVSNVDNIFIGGSLIVNGSVKITSNPEVKLNNISALEMLINASNIDIFSDSVKDSNKGKDNKNDKDNGKGNNQDETGGNVSEYIDGRLIFDNWKVE